MCPEMKFSSMCPCAMLQSRHFPCELKGSCLCILIFPRSLEYCLWGLNRHFAGACRIGATLKGHHGRRTCKVRMTYMHVCVVPLLHCIPILDGIRRCARVCSISLPPPLRRPSPPYPCSTISASPSEGSWPSMQAGQLL
jgi:hypothetical protein